MMLGHALRKCRWLDAQALGRSLAAAIRMHAIIAQRLCVQHPQTPAALGPARAAAESHNCLSDSAVLMTAAASRDTQYPSK